MPYSFVCSLNFPLYCISSLSQLLYGNAAHCASNKHWEHFLSSMSSILWFKRSFSAERAMIRRQSFKPIFLFFASLAASKSWHFKRNWRFAGRKPSISRNLYVQISKSSITGPRYSIGWLAVATVHITTHKINSSFQRYSVLIDDNDWSVCTLNLLHRTRGSHYWL